MKKQVGLLIMKDENDILEEYLTKITQFYDPIYVLDGTESNEGKEICSKFSEVVFYEKDKNVIQGKSNDSIRGFLWEKIKREVTGKEWVAILHPDEFPESNPLELLDFVSSLPAYYSSIIVRSLHFFLHTSQKEGWEFKQGDKIEPLMKWHMAPGMTEARFFRFNTDFFYSTSHSQTVPPNAQPAVFIDNFRLKQFSFRSVKQSIDRINSRIESEWQPNDYVVLKEHGDIFIDTLKWPDELKTKYPVQGMHCWYNQDWAYVDKLS